MNWEEPGKQASVLTVNGNPYFKVQRNSQFGLINGLYVLGDVIFFAGTTGKLLWQIWLVTENPSTLFVRTVCFGLCFQTLFLPLTIFMHYVTIDV